MTQDAQALVEAAAHRPWPLPPRLWVMRQSWHDLLFAHWPIDPQVLTPFVPAEFTLDLFGGRAWLAVVPFYMTGVTPRGMPALPWISRFPELNVRTYVRVDDKPGVFFLSLDAGNRLAARVARSVLNLPYFSAAMDIDDRGGEVHYRSRRRSEPPAEFRATYRATGSAFAAPAGSLEYFLVERYCLYACDRSGRPYRLEIHHRPWSLQCAAAEITQNTMTSVHGIELPAITPLLHFVKRQDMVAWSPTPLTRRDDDRRQRS
jgi:uncharacterized protein YqjF (DUF2071 family)